MALETDSLVVHVSGQEYTTVGWVVETLTAFEYAYNLAVVVDLTNQGSHFYGATARQLADIVERAPEFGFATANFLLRGYLPPEAQAQLESIHAKNSFEFALTGLGEPIRELRQAVEGLDPINRKKKKEDNRHTEVMNRLEEDATAAKIHAEKLNSIVAFVERVEQKNWGLGEDDEKQLKQNLISEMIRSQLAIGRNELKVVEDPSA